MLFRRCFLLVVALVIASGQTGAQSVQDDGTIRHIDAGDTVEGHLSGGRPAKFAITLAAASFATVVVSHRLDIVVRAIAEGRDPSTTALGDVCTRDVQGLSPESTVQDAIAMMRDQAVRRLPVCDEGQVLGIVSLGDLAVEREPQSVLGDISAAPPQS